MSESASRALRRSSPQCPLRSQRFFDPCRGATAEHAEGAEDQMSRAKIFIRRLGVKIGHRRS